MWKICITACHKHSIQKKPQWNFLYIMIAHCKKMSVIEDSVHRVHHPDSLQCNINAKSKKEEREE